MNACRHVFRQIGRTNLAVCERCGKTIFRRIMINKYSFRTFIGALAVIASLILTGCPSQKTIAKAKESSAKLASYANTGVNVTRDLYREQIISLELKDKIADAFIVLADGGIAFDAAIHKAEVAYGQNPPQSQIDALFATFDAEVVGNFLTVLERLKLVTNATAYLAVIESIKAAILIVADAFGRKGVTEAKLTI